MKTELERLYNTMGLIETKGESTKIMAQCLDFLANLVKQADDYVKKEGDENGD